MKERKEYKLIFYEAPRRYKIRYYAKDDKSILERTKKDIFGLLNNSYTFTCLEKIVCIREKREVDLKKFEEWLKNYCKRTMHPREYSWYLERYEDHKKKIEEVKR